MSFAIPKIIKGAASGNIPITLKPRLSFIFIANAIQLSNIFRIEINVFFIRSEKSNLSNSNRFFLFRSRIKDFITFAHNSPVGGWIDEPPLHPCVAWAERIGCAEHPKRNRPRNLAIWPHGRLSGRNDVPAYPTVLLRRVGRAIARYHVVIEFRSRIFGKLIPTDKRIFLTMIIPVIAVALCDTKFQNFAARPNPFEIGSRLKKFGTIIKGRKPSLRLFDDIAKILIFAIKDNAAPKRSVANSNELSEIHQLRVGFTRAARSSVKRVIAWRSYRDLLR